MSHPLFLFNQFGDPGALPPAAWHVHSAEDWRAVLEPVLAANPDFSQPIGAAGGLTVGTQEVTGAAVSVGG
jgi:hypothetical protein